jgi:hypothetical protein
MVDVTKAMESSYLNPDMVRESPSRRCVIIDEGAYIEGEYEGKKYEKLELKVQIDGKTKTWSPNKDSVKNLAQEYGSDSAVWVGKVIKLSIQKLRGRDCVIGFPITPGTKVSLDYIQ